MAPTYFSERKHPCTSPGTLKSTNQLLEIPGTRPRGRGDRAFSVVVPTLNNLPLYFRAAQTVNDL